MSLVTSFVVLLQPLTLVMTSPSFENLVANFIAGWTFGPKRTVTAMLQAAGTVGVKHH